MKRRPPSPYLVPDYVWALLTMGGLCSAMAVAAHLGPAGALIGLSPFVGTMAALSSTSSEIRPPTQEEARIIVQARQLTGARLPIAVRLPRSGRTWGDRILLGIGVTVFGIVIGYAQL